MENPTALPCSAPRCTSPAAWRIAPAFSWELPDTALTVRGRLFCSDHLTLGDLTWMPGLRHGMVVVVDPSPAPAGTDEERSDTVRMPSHLIDVDELRPSVTGDATQLIEGPGRRSGKPAVPPAVVHVPGQLRLPRSGA